jgi:myo-inositol catabolism protein IolC
MQLGYDKPLFILPFDHRASFEKGLFGFSPPLSSAQTATVATSKQVVYDGFQAALARDVPREAAGILVDEQFGADILRDARKNELVFCAPVEQSGQAEFQFQYANDWQEHIATFNPTFAKVLVRYNPDDDAALNRRQALRLRELSEFLRRTSRRFMFELLVPMTYEQSDRIEGNQRLYDEELRPPLMVSAIRQLQDAGVEPDVWKVEGMTSRDDCKALVAAARRGGRDRVSCIVLGRGADETGIVAWLRAAAQVQGFIGFAVGRTSFWDALVALRDGTITRDTAVEQIAARYVEWIRIFREAERAGRS